MTKKSDHMLPLYEAKMIHHFDHRWNSFDSSGKVQRPTQRRKMDSSFEPLPRYWVESSAVREQLRDEDYLVGLRAITRSTDERTVIPALLPVSAAGNSLYVLSCRVPSLRLRLVAYLSSFVLDFVARPKIGGINLNFFIINQLALPAPDSLASCGWCPKLGSWIDRRVISLAGQSVQLASAFGVEPTSLSEDDRPLIRAELDAMFFHLLEIRREDVDYIMETFPIVKRKDIAEHGSFRTKEMILEVYDAMQVAIDSGEPYESPLEHLLVGEPQGIDGNE